MRAGTRARLFAIGIAFAASLVGSPAPGATRYVFTTFRGDAAADEKLSVYTSSNGLDFELLSNTGYGGPTGVLRDPSIMKHSDGKYYVAYTLQSWTTASMSFGIASSADLEKWTFLVEVPAGVSGEHFTWAPEWFKDTDGIHLIVNIDEGSSQFRAYDFKATSDDLKSWDAPVEMGIGPNNIDTFVVKSGATYHAFSKNETTKYIEHATASSFHGPWTWVGKNDWAGWGSGKEGIALFQLDDGSWRMFLDCYGGCGFLYADSDDLDEWTGTKTVPGGLSGTVRHGTVLREETGTGGLGGGGMAGDAGAQNAGRANAGAAGLTSNGGAAGDGGRGAMNASGGGGAATGGSAGSMTGVGGRDGGMYAAGTTNGAGNGGDATSGAGGSAGQNAGGGTSAGTTNGAVPGGTTSTESPLSGADSSGCGCALPRRTTNAPRAALLAVALLALGRRRSLSP